ncbi:MAG: hypothetical protein ABSG84_17465 [Acidobacteriaceae bacterium]
MAKLPFNRADDARQGPRGLAAIFDRFSYIRWVDMNVEDGNSRVGEQYDLSVIRMIYERADCIQQHLANPTFGFGSDAWRRCQAAPLCLRSKAREFS